MEVNVVNLKRYFGRTRAVDDISFQFRSDHIFGFIGPNGAGKTTTMRVLATLDEPTSGDAYLDGYSVVEDPEKARRLIGFMPDSLPTHRDMTVHEYLDFFARAYGLAGRKRTRAIEAIESFTNLAGLREKLLGSLSKGMKQRVSLARALVHDPPVLVLDEPAAGLDPRARVEVRELLKALADQGKAILVSSHILSELAEICNGAIIIERGKILAAGTMADIVAREVPHRSVIIRPAGRIEELHKELVQMANVASARIDGAQVIAQVTGSDETCSDLLAGLVQKGFRIVEFRLRQADLEDVFMSITKGEVQ
jgi:ABC-2 type transport system ATP-binding protein